MTSMPIKTLEVSKSLIGEPILTLRLDRSASNQINEIGAINDFTGYEVSIAKKRKRRSLDANSYCWVLIGKIAQKIETSADEVYRELIRNIGSYKVLPIKEDTVKQWEQIWTSKGTGWLVEDMGESKLEGYRNIRCWYGSSVYDSKEMTRLIDEVIRECKELEIETMTPVEIERMKEQWG